jgi:LysM repeat protein
LFISGKVTLFVTQLVDNKKQGLSGIVMLDRSFDAAGTKEPAGLDIDAAGLYKSSLNKSGSVDDSATDHAVPQSQHTLAEGETLESIARKTLGPEVRESEVSRYASTVARANGLSASDKLQPGQKLDMPGRKEDGTLTFKNPDNKNEDWELHEDNTIDSHSKSDGSSYKRVPVDDYGSYKEHHTGPKMGDDYDKSYFYKDDTSVISTTDADGNTVAVASDGTVKRTDKDGNWTTDYDSSNDFDHASYDKTSGVTTQHFRDGSTVKTWDSDSHSEFVSKSFDADGTKTTKWQDGSSMVEKKDAQGYESGYTRQPDQNGGYKEHGWGPQPKDNYDESYDPQTGQTTRAEGKGTAEEKTTTAWSDGSKKVEAKDGNNYQRNPDGSEHHWGKENYDKPADDYQHDDHLNSAKDTLDQAVKDHVAADKQAGFKEDMDSFEARAQKEHLAPEEVAKTYDQISRMLNVSKDSAVVSEQDRAILASGLLHQCAHPEATAQGRHNTCNVTTVAYDTLQRNPSKAAEMAATTSITGEWTAADGKVIKIDKQSLQPRSEEAVYPVADGHRSFATQVLNLVMANDALQRSVPPEFYIQRTPDGDIPDDTGERRLDARGNVIKKMADGLLIPDASPNLTDREIAQVGQRLNGDNSHFIAFNDPQSGVDSIKSEEAFGQRLHQLNQQGQFPVTLAVDSHHFPIREVTQEIPGLGYHAVSIDDYDETTGRVHISNQWGKKYNKWVNQSDLYKNATGANAASKDGVDLDYIH